jgi:transposase
VSRSFADSLVIQLVPQLKILVCVAPIDFRKGVQTLSALCRIELDEDPFSGALYVFRNRSATALKILVFDGTGVWLIFKRFSQGRLHWWPTPGDTKLHPLASHELAVLLNAGDPPGARFAEPWRKIS